MARNAATFADVAPSNGTWLRSPPARPAARALAAWSGVGGVLTLQAVSVATSVSAPTAPTAARCRRFRLGCRMTPILTSTTTRNERRTHALSRCPSGCDRGWGARGGQDRRGAARRGVCGVDRPLRGREARPVRPPAALQGVPQGRAERRGRVRPAGVLVRGPRRRPAPRDRGDLGRRRGPRGRRDRREPYRIRQARARHRRLPAAQRPAGGRPRWSALPADHRGQRAAPRGVPEGRERRHRRWWLDRAGGRLGGPRGRRQGHRPGDGRAAAAGRGRPEARRVLRGPAP